MKNAFHIHTLLILLCMAAGASLAMLAPSPSPLERTADPPLYTIPVREDQTQLLRVNHNLLRQEFVTAGTGDNTVERSDQTTQNNDVPLPSEPLLFFGLVHQNGRARALMGESPTSYPLRSYTAGETLPGGETLQKIGRDSIVVEKPDGAIVRMDLYSGKDIGQPPTPNP